MLVLVAGGPASGKATVCKQVEKLITTENNEIKVEDIDLNKWQTGYGPNVDFSSFKNHIKQFDSNVVLLVHGKYALFDEELRSLASIKVFVDTDSDEQLSQWLLRDKHTRDINDILDEYLNKARVEFVQYIKDTQKYADVLLPRGLDTVGTQVISMNIVDRLGNDDLRYTKNSKPIDLRKELFQELDGRYYAAT